MVAERSTTKRSPKKRRARESAAGSSTRDGSGNGMAVTVKYFAEESELPRDKTRPALASLQQEFVLRRSDEMAAIIPSAPEPKVLTIEFDPIVVHTIALLRYRRILSEPGVTAARIGPVPECGTSRPSLLNPWSESTDHLTDETAEALLDKAVELLCAHGGFIVYFFYWMSKSSCRFTEADFRVVKLLTRITASKLQELWRNCKISNVRRCEGSETAFTKFLVRILLWANFFAVLMLRRCFQSPMMHVLQLAGVSRLTDLRDFYIRRFRDRRDQLLALCQHGREAFLKPPEKRVSTKKRSRRDGSRSDSEDETDTHKRECADKESVSELNFLDDG
ncbi:unnamed protein product [Toxocara canis]|uniref:BTB domain-containing protein n=1 Tax=Toxocara canis TaxID=6265 RepID=A0A183UDB2_TOXCA|nr:unnamed protein product [Toxocara canis]